MLAASLITTSVGTASLDRTDPEFARLSASASPDGTIVLTHDGGQPIDVRRVSVNVSVEGQRLTQQPPVPFFSAPGFEPGPTGPFNSAADPEWTVGEQASFTLSDSNEPGLQPGADVTVTVLRDETPLTRVRTSVAGDGPD